MNTRRERDGFFGLLCERVREVAADPSPLDEKLLGVCRLLEANVPHYGWVGFYLRNPDEKDELVLGPFVGEPTSHVRIPFGRGVCGRAAERAETVLVQDVTRDPDYQTCSVDVKSELVVPVFSGGTLVAQIDVDSHTPSAFTDADRAFLETVSEVLSVLF